MRVTVDMIVCSFIVAATTRYRYTGAPKIIFFLFVTDANVSHCYKFRKSVS